MFQCLARFPRKIVLYSSTNFRILKPSVITSNLIRFDLGFWHVSKPFYRKLKYTEKVLEEFPRVPCFPRKMVLYSSTNFRILKLWVIISNLIRFDLGFWQASKRLCRKLQYREKVLEEFQRLRRSTGKIVLYSSTNFRVLKTWAIISNLVRFDLGFERLRNHFIGNLNIGRSIWKSLNVCLAFSEKWFCICEPIFAF